MNKLILIGMVAFLVFLVGCDKYDPSLHVCTKGTFGLGGDIAIYTTQEFDEKGIKENYQIYADKKWPLVCEEHRDKEYCETIEGLTDTQKCFCIKYAEQEYTVLFNDFTTKKITASEIRLYQKDKAGNTKEIYPVPNCIESREKTNRERFEDLTCENILNAYFEDIKICEDFLVIPSDQLCGGDGWGERGWLSYNEKNEIITLANFKGCDYKKYIPTN